MLSPKTLPKFSVHFYWLLVFFMGVFLFRSLWVQLYCSRIPLLDEWDAWVSMLYIPLQEGRFQLNTLWAPHNEHRIMLTRLVALAHQLVYGGLPVKAMMLFNAFFMATLATCLLIPLLKLTQTFFMRLTVCTLMFLIFCGYADYENTLWAFQFQFYSQIAAAFLLFYLYHQWHVNKLSAWWIIGLAILLPFTNAAGPLAILPLLILTSYACLTQLRTHQAWQKPFFLCLGLCVALLFAGLIHQSVPSHEILKAKNFQQWAQTFLILLSYPLSKANGYLPVLWLPCCSLFFLKKSNTPVKTRVHSTQIFLIATWLLLLCAVTAYSRGGYTSAVLSSRYITFLSLAMFVNIWAALVIAQVYKNMFSLKLTHAYLFLCGASLLLGLHYARWEHPDFTSSLLNHQNLVRDYLRTGNAQFLQGQIFKEIPYPDSVRLKMLIDQPDVTRELKKRLKLNQGN